MKNNTPDLNVENPTVIGSEKLTAIQPRSSWKKKLLLTGGALFGACSIAAASATIWYQYNLQGTPEK